MTPALRRVVFLSALLVVVGVHCFALVHGIVFSRVWGDEGYNLTVAVNLAAGHGYASDGLLTSGRFDFFDPRVSTGPMVLLPIAGAIWLGLDTVTAGRLVMSLFFVAAVAGIGALGWKIAKHAGLVIALAVPLAFDATNPDSPMQSPIDVIGEWPAAGLLAWALVVLGRRPWLAGLFLGLAVQAKLVAVISIPVILVMVLVTSTPLRARIRVILTVGIVASLPTLAFELVKLGQLGLGGYARWFGEFLEFLTLKKIPFLPLDKGRALLDSWFIPSTWAVVAILVVGIAATLLAVRQVGSRTAVQLVRRGSDYWLVAVCILLAIVWAVWWIQSRADLIWIRHLFPGFVPAVAGFLAGAWRAWVGLSRSSERINRIAGSAALVCCVVALAIGTGGRLWYITHPPIPETLGEQRVIADAVRDHGGDELVGPWGSIPIAILAGMHPVSLGMPHDADSATLLVEGEVGWDDPALCPREVWVLDGYRLCVDSPN